MNTHRYFLLFCLGCLTVATSLSANVYLSLNNKNEAGRWVYECLTKKSEAVVNHDPEIIILSGSNSLFGFSAKKLNDIYGIRTVNAAVHGGLGIDYMLYYGRKFFKEGRVFILPLEYELYGRTTPSDTQYYQVIGYDPEYLYNLKILHKIKFSTGISFNTHRHLLIYSLWPKPKRDDGYQSKTLNLFGDETNNSPDNVTPEMLARLNALPKKYQVNDDAWNQIVQFSQDAKEAGAIVVLAFPNIFFNAFDPQINSEFISELKEKSKEAKILLIGEPEDRVFYEKHVYDTLYHQNTLGQMRSTDILYQQLVNANILQSGNFVIPPPKNLE